MGLELELEQSGKIPAGLNVTETIGLNSVSLFGGITSLTKEAPNRGDEVVTDKILAGFLIWVSGGDEKREHYTCKS
jgi:hypothetical protein